MAQLVLAGLPSDLLDRLEPHARQLGISITEAAARLLTHALASALEPAWVSDEDPDLGALEGPLRDALARRGHDPDEVLRRAAASVQQAQDNQQPPTDEDIQRAAGWILGRP